MCQNYRCDVASYTKNKTKDEVYYPILKKIVMWLNIEWKVSLKVKGDNGESIIYTAKDLGEWVRNIWQ
jgi:hypothetical protein